eukprot:TRINITY_DN60789_c0_g1_i1.p1 TRINITY_DN60789_c0_g1~~TRINITY_DN60789_c0_g1_i1.p1  ORF type:complete len:490 (+),score=129.58 TRINITY_DN60789_c0_g1_i1:91-1560(+)
MTEADEKKAVSAETDEKLEEEDRLSAGGPKAVADAAEESEAKIGNDSEDKAKQDEGEEKGKEDDGDENAKDDEDQDWSNWKRKRWSGDEKSEDWNKSDNTEKRPWAGEKDDTGETVDNDNSGKVEKGDASILKSDKLGMALDDLITTDRGRNKSRGKGWQQSRDGGGWGDNKGSWRASGGGEGGGGGRGGGGGGNWKDWKKEDWSSGKDVRKDGGSGGGGEGGGGGRNSSWGRDAWKNENSGKSDWKSRKGGDDWQGSKWNGGGGSGGGGHHKSYDTASNDQAKTGGDRRVVVYHDVSGRGGRKDSCNIGRDRQHPSTVGDSRRDAVKSSERTAIIVAGIDGLKVDRRDLEKAFSEAGPVDRCIVSDKSATIYFRDARSAQTAVRRFHGGQLNDRAIDVYFEGDEPPKRAVGGRSRSRRARGGRASPMRGGGRKRKESPVSRSRSRRPRSGGGVAGDRRTDRRIADDRARRSRREPSPRRTAAGGRSRR